MAPKQKPGRSKQDYTTPIEFLTAVRKRLDIINFDIDLAADPANAVCGRYYTERDDSLIQPWRRVGEGWGGPGGWNWLNPPFANINKWVKKAYDEMHLHNVSTAVLIPAGVGSNWWRDWVHHKAYAIMLNGRLVFGGTEVNPKTGKRDPYPKDLALLLYHHGMHGYETWTWETK